MTAGAIRRGGVHIAGKPSLPSPPKKKSSRKGRNKLAAAAAAAKGEEEEESPKVYNKGVHRGKECE